MDEHSIHDRASETAAKAGQAATGAVQQASASMQGMLDQGKAMARDAQAGAAGLARQASEAGRQAMAQAGEVVQGVQGAAREAGNQATRAAASLYEQGSQAGDVITRYTAQQPVAALLIAAAVGYGLAYLIHRR